MATRSDIRRAAAGALAAGLCIAAVAGIVALLRGELSDNDWKVIGTSLGFAVFSATAAVGTALRLRPSPGRRALGTATAAVSAVAFLLLLIALWIDDGGDSLWRAWGCVALATLAASHASLVLGAMRTDDPQHVRLLALCSVGLAAVDATCGILPLSGLAEDVVSEDGARVLAVLVVLLLLTTALPPIMRRGGPRAAPASARPGDLADEVLATVARIESLAPSADVRRECERLRRLAEAHRH